MVALVLEDDCGVALDGLGGVAERRGGGVGDVYVTVARDISAPSRDAQTPLRAAHFLAAVIPDSSISALRKRIQ